MSAPKLHLLGTAGLMLALAVPLAAHASVNWNFTSGGTNSSSNYGNVRTFTSDGNTVSATAWSDTGSGWGTGNDDEIYDAYLGRWSGGLGAENRDENGTSPEHSMDNYGDFDFILFDFGAAAGQTFSMETVSVGWAPYDSDLSVLAYLGDNPPPTVANQTFSGLLGDGWSLVSHVSNVTSAPNDTAIVQNPAAVSSSWWIVSAYNPAFGDPDDWSTGNDKMKISALSGFFEETQNGGGGTPGVPEPSSLLLLGLGLPLLRGLRRRRG